MGRSQARIEATVDTPRHIRLAAANYLLKGVARRAHTKLGREHTAEIVSTVLDGNGGIIYRFERNSQLRGDLYNEGVKNVFRAKTEEGFRNSLAGGVLSAIAMPFIIATESLQGNTVIDSSTTLEVMKTLYPDAEELHDAFGGTSLRGLSVPDFLVVSKSGRIIKVGEFKSSLREHDNRSLERQLSWERDRFQDFPELTVDGGPDLLLVTPNLQTDSIPTYVSADKRIQHMMLPFNGGKLREIIVDLFYRYRPEANRGGYKTGRKGRRMPEEVDELDQFGPTLEELWKERRLQEVRGKDALVVASAHAVPTTTEMVELARAGVVFDPEALLTDRKIIAEIEEELRAMQYPASGNSLSDAA